jgi:hypothetical protein
LGEFDELLRRPAIISGVPVNKPIPGERLGGPYCEISLIKVVKIIDIVLQDFFKAIIICTKYNNVIIIK